MQFFEDFQLKFAQLAVGDDEEVATAARGVEKAQLCQSFVKFDEFGRVALDFFKLGPERVEKQWFDEFKDVFLGGVVCAEVAPRGGVHDGLKQAAENRGADA